MPSYSERRFLVPISDINSETVSELLPVVGSIDTLEYKIGAGDQFFVSLSGVIFETIELPVNPEGKVFIPKIGLIKVAGNSLYTAKEIIRKSILESYQDVEISIALTKIRTIKIKLIGNVSKPKSYILPANLRLSDLIINSNSLLEDSNIRNIEVISVNGDRKKFDLLAYLREGDETNNPYLHDDELVLINRADDVVSIFGAVFYPGKYEFKENESAGELISLAGGFTKKAKTDTIEIASFDPTGKILKSTYYSSEDIKSSSIKLNSGDKIFVRFKPEFMVDRLVSVEGFVKFPGSFKIKKDSTKLKSLLLNEAGGFLENASLKNAYVERNIGIEETDPEYERLKLIPRIDMTDDEYDYFKAKSRQRKGRMVVDFERLFLGNDETEDLILKRNDVIVIPEKKDFITLVGQVQKPGNIIYKPELTIEQYIDLAGGFSWRAIEDDIRVIKANSGEWFEADEINELNPGDIIWIPEETPPPDFWEIFTTSLTIIGQVATIVAALAAVIVASRN